MSLVQDLPLLNVHAGRIRHLIAHLSTRIAFLRGPLTVVTCRDGIKTFRFRDRNLYLTQFRFRFLRDTGATNVKDGKNGRIATRRRRTLLTSAIANVLRVGNRDGRVVDNGIQLVRLRITMHGNNVTRAMTRHPLCKRLHIMIVDTFRLLTSIFTQFMIMHGRQISFLQVDRERLSTRINITNGRIYRHVTTMITQGRNISRDLYRELSINCRT